MNKFNVIIIIAIIAIADLIFVNLGLDNKGNIVKEDLYFGLALLSNIFIVVGILAYIFFFK